MRRRPDPGGGSELDARFATDHLQPDLTRRAVRGGVVTLSAQACKLAAQFATIVILARLLTPEDFGVFAVAAAVLLLLELFKDLGLSGATVQRPCITDSQVSTLFWLNGALGVLVAATMSLAAPLLAALYDEPALAELAPAVSLTLILTGFSVQHMALLRRQMRFSALAMIQTGAELFAMAAAIGAALAGFGIWALVVQRIAWGGVIAGGAWIAAGWRPRAPGAFSDVRDLVAFGGNATGAMVLGRCTESFNQLLIGWYWGAPSLGLYERAQRLVMMPIRNVNMPLSAVALPMLSRLVDRPAAYRRAYIAIVERVAMAIAPVAGLIMAGAADVTELVLGDQWSGAAPILAWMGLAAIYMPVTYTLSWLYMSQDRTPEMLRAGLLNAGISLVAVVAAVPFGTVAIAASFAVSGVLLRVPLLVWLVCRRGPLSVTDIGCVFALPVCGAVAAASAVYAVGMVPALDAWPVAAVVALEAAAAVVGALIVYGAIPRGRRTIAESLQIPRMVLTRGARA